MHGGCGRLLQPNCRLRVLVVCWLAIAAATPFALAQGLRGKLADPISTRDLELYETMLGLSPGQEEAADRLHQDYVKLFRALRQGPVDRFLKEHKDVVSVYEVPDDPAIPRESVRVLRDLQGRVQLLDDQFFSQIQSVLTEDQADELPVIRGIRRRARYRQGTAWLTQSPFLNVDLAVILSDLNLTTEERPAVAAIMVGYETNLLKALKELDEATANLRIEIVERQIALAAMAKEQDLWLMAIVLRDLYTEQANLAAEIGDLHRKTCKSLRSALTESNLEQLRHRYHSLVYPEIQTGLGLADIQFREALGRETLTEEQLGEVRARQGLYRISACLIKERMLDVIDALRRSSASHPLQLSSGDGDYYEDKAFYTDKLDRLQIQLNRANETALLVLGEIIGDRIAFGDTPANSSPSEKLATPLVVTLVSSSRDGPRHYRQIRIPLEQLAIQFGPPGDGGSDRFIPQPISEGQLDSWASRLNLDEDAIAVLECLHQEYRERFLDLSTTGPIALARRAQDAMFTRDGSGRVLIPTGAEVNALFDLRETAVRQVMQIDAGFFDEISLVWDDEPTAETISRSRNDRLRAIYRLAGPADKAPGVREPALHFASRESDAVWYPGEAPDIELASIVDEIACDPTIQTQAHDIIQSNEVVVTELLRRRYEARFEMERRRATMMADHLQPGEEGFFQTTSITLDPEMEDLDQRIHELTEGIRAANQTGRDALLAVFPADARWELQHGYLRAGYPEVYQDESALHGLLTAAQRLDNLEQTKGSALSKLAYEFRSGYEEICKLITQTGRDREARARFMADRQEFNDRTLARLRSLLTPDQSRQIGLGSSVSAASATDKPSIEVAAPEEASPQAAAPKSNQSSTFASSDGPFGSAWRRILSRSSEVNAGRYPKLGSVLRYLNASYRESLIVHSPYGHQILPCRTFSALDYWSMPQTQAAAVPG